VASALDAGTAAVTVAGVVAGLAYIAGHLELGRRVFRDKRLQVHHPTPD
jgi:hypothetical protein